MIDVAINSAIDVRVVAGPDVRQRPQVWARWLASSPARPVGADPTWLLALADGLGHVPYLLEAHHEGQIIGLLPLALVNGPLFGRFLVSLPYVSTCGVIGSEAAVQPLIETAVALADELRVKHLELRLDAAVDHPALSLSASDKVLMRRELPDSIEALWKDLDSKVRNQIRKGDKQGFQVTWGGQEQLDAFYAVFSRNMRDLGTPVFGRRFFASILRHFPDSAEICAVRLHDRPVAGALLIHGRNISEVPSASTLREYNAANANMFMYWQLLQRAISRGQRLFDFGRSTAGSGAHRFKAQWGAESTPAVWQCYFRRAGRGTLRKESQAFRALSHVWQWLPLGLADLIGPAIVRGIP